jgi:small subunit ribosomal protein S8
LKVLKKKEENHNHNICKMNTDPIADYLTRIRNAMAANHRVVEIPASNLKKQITKILFDQGYILSYKFEDTTAQGSIKIALKYDKDTKESVIKKLQRISKPGLRKYAGANEIPRILNGLGIAIVSTSKGVMTGKQAQREKVGGELLCYVY